MERIPWKMGRGYEDRKTYHGVSWTGSNNTSPEDWTIGIVEWTEEVLRRAMHSRSSRCQFSYPELSRSFTAAVPQLASISTGDVSIWSVATEYPGLVQNQHWYS